MQRALRLSGVVPVGDAVYDLWNLPPKTDTVILIGGRGGMKTYGVSDYIAHQAAVNKKRCVILRDEKSLIKDSILNEILIRYDSIPFNTNTERLQTGLRDKDSGEDVVFTKGFRASENSKKANLKGISNIDIAVIEEMEDLTDEDKFNTFVDSLRKEGCLVILILNTPDIGHFVLKNYFYTTTSSPIPEHIPPHLKKEFEGYFEIVPKDIPGAVIIKTGYETNPFLPENVKQRYEAYCDPESPKFNPHYYMTAIKGYASTGRKGQVLKKVKPISLEEYLALPYVEYFGQDFGTSSPAGLVGVKIHRNKSWCRQLNYKPLPTLEIAKLYCTLQITHDEIIADNADEKAIRTLRNGFDPNDLSADDLKAFPALITGFNVMKCTKGTDSIRFGLDTMDGMELVAGKESEDLWNEIRNYIYAKNKNDEYTNTPIDDFNHLIDPWRYVINEKRGKSYQASHAG